MMRSREGEDGAGSSAPSPSLPPFLDPPFEVFATDLAVDMALAWIAELAASSSAAADAEADDGGEEEEEEEEEEKEERRRSSARRCSSSSRSRSRSHSRPLSHLPAPALASLTEWARRDILGGQRQSGDENTLGGLRAWRRAYPAALAAALLSGDNKSGSASGKEIRNGKGNGNGNGNGTSSIKGQVVTRVQYGERVRLRGGRLCAVATPAGGPSSPGSAIWTLVDSVAEGAASLAACSGRRVGVGEGRGHEEEGGETGVARVVCVGAFGATPNPSSAAAPLNVAALRGAHVLVLAPPGAPPPPPPPPHPRHLLKTENNAAAVAAPSSSNSSSSSLAAAAAAAVAAIERGGNALLPVSAGDGRALELIECVLSALYARGGHGLLARVPCVFASPGARRGAAAACSSAEWLCAARSALVLSGRAPYFAGPAASAAASVIGSGGGGGGGGGSEQGGAALRSSNSNSSSSGGGGLLVADSLSQSRKLHGWREPCVAFVPATSLFNSSGGGSGGGSGGSGSGGGGGDGAALLRAWGGDPRSAFVFTCSSSLPSGVRLSQLVARALPGIRARIVDAEAEAAVRGAEAAESAAPASAASALCALVAAVSPAVVVVPRAWERAMLRSESTSIPPLGRACDRVEALDPLVPLELAEGGEGEEEEEGEDGGSELVLPRALSRAGVTSELAFAASKVEAKKSRFSPRVLLALATVRDGGVELDAPPGVAGGAALAAALVAGGGAQKGKKRRKKRRKTTEEGEEDAAAAVPPSSLSALDALLCDLGAPAVKVE